MASSWRWERIKDICWDVAAGWDDDTRDRLEADIADLDVIVAEFPALARAVALHRPETIFGVECCGECSADWPCPTTRRANGEDNRG